MESRKRKGEEEDGGEGLKVIQGEIHKNHGLGKGESWIFGSPPETPKKPRGKNRMESKNGVCHDSTFLYSTQRHGGLRRGGKQDHTISKTIVRGQGKINGGR